MAMIPATIEVSTSAAGSFIVHRGPPRVDPGTLTQLFFDAVEKFSKPAALRFKRDGSWLDISHGELLQRVRRVSLALQDLALSRGDRIAILSENRPEWAIADYACLTAGMADVPIYPTLPAEQMVHILNDSGAVVMFVSTREQAAKIARIRPDVPSLKRVISFCAPAPVGCDITMDEFMAQGAALDTADRAAAWKASALQAQPDDLATLIYTSGTTGLPKGVMLTHDNLFSNVRGSLSVLEPQDDDVALSFLPLSHIFERMCGHYMLFAGGCTIAYAESIDTVAANLVEVRPSILSSVPRIYEKLYARIMEGGNAGSGIKKAIFRWSLGVADEWADTYLAKREPGRLLAFKYAIAQKLVFSKIKAKLGGRLRVACSGGAPLAATINKFFVAAGLTLVEGYGLTETSPVISVNRLNNIRIGTVGELIAGVEVAIAKDGEILTRGPSVMKGYYRDSQATAEAIDEARWFHTGDIGSMEDGFLRITDRKKDIIVTAGGKNIAPQPIENRVVTNAFVSQAVMIGDTRKFPVMLVVPSWDALLKWTAHKGITSTDRTALLTNAQVVEKLDREVRGEMEGLARFEAPKKIALLEHEFTIEGGELTPSLKVKRRVINEKYKGVIDALYDTDSAGE
ncbi:MAG: long-chain fatty acid--CoA ligase [Gemmatimonadaceae bacterium]|nr:long-chain fatty acid--CoA ligase [Gemmatimonadaceae bacterium]